MEDFSRYRTSYTVAYPDEQLGIAQEHIQRAKQGKEVWNAWINQFEQYIKENH